MMALCFHHRGWRGNRRGFRVIKVRDKRYLSGKACVYPPGKSTLLVSLVIGARTILFAQANSLKPAYVGLQFGTEQADDVVRGNYPGQLLFVVHDR
jgi:hypothetical protein